jgi:predicted nuclease of predicted toxin-antitoxin system
MSPPDYPPLKLKTDENLPRALVDLLIEAGFDAVSVQDQDLAGTDDRSLFEVCARERRALLTLDLDFSDITTYPPETHSGIVVFRLPRLSARAVLELAARLVPMLKECDSLQGQLWVVDKQRVRIRSVEDDA